LFEIYDKIKNFKDTNKGNYIPSYPKFEISVIGAVAWNLIHEKNYNKEEVYYFMTSMMLFGGGNNPHKIISKLYKKLDKDSRARKSEKMSFDAFKDLVTSSYEKYLKEINKINKCAC
jgi:Mg2+ and Co2+ transporter CorA